jgi:hypothetical protein
MRKERILARSGHVPISKTGRGATACREQVVCLTSRYRKDTLGSDECLQSRSPKSVRVAGEKSMSDRLLAQGFELWPA